MKKKQENRQNKKGKKLKKKLEKQLKKLRPETAFEAYRHTLSDVESGAVSDFFAELDGHVALGKGEKEKMRGDFENALLYYASAGVPFGEAFERLDIGNLGGFYARPAVMWYALDDAAKIYPLSMKHGQMALFRLSVYLTEPVVPELLQMALTFTIKRFPSFATTVKKGFFWHYLDTSKRRYSIQQETCTPCRPLIVSKSGSQSFRVLYWNNRISAEYFHVLTDGTGGMVFLKTLTAEYLRLLGIKSNGGAGILNISDTPSRSETSNEFRRADNSDKASGFAGRAAVQLGGSLSSRKPCRILHFKMDAARLKELAEGCGVTVTAYVLALLFIACRSAIDELSGSINIQIPVNMRKFYPSDTLRNFSLYCGIKLPLDQITDIPSILGAITSQLEEKAAKPAMDEMMNATNRMVEMMRYVPLSIKAPVAKAVYGFLSDRPFSNTLSNLGVVDMPPELGEHILSMDFVLGTVFTNRASCAMVTFGGVATLTVSKMTADPSFEEKLYALLLSNGIQTTMEGSELYES